jgi:hypothetical protein
MLIGSTASAFANSTYTENTYNIESSVNSYKEKLNKLIIWI